MGLSQHDHGPNGHDGHGKGRHSHGVLLYYQVAALSCSEVASARDWLQSICEAQELVGRVRVSPQGFNCTLGGPWQSLEAHIDTLQVDERFRGCDFKLEPCDWPPSPLLAKECGFAGLSVRVVNELVTLGGGRHVSLSLAGPHLTPRQFHSMLSSPLQHPPRVEHPAVSAAAATAEGDGEIAVKTAGAEPERQPVQQEGQEARNGGTIAEERRGAVVLLDVRNVYETRVGRFCPPLLARDSGNNSSSSSSNSTSSSTTTTSISTSASTSSRTSTSNSSMGGGYGCCRPGPSSVDASCEVNGCAVGHKPAYTSVKAAAAATAAVAASDAVTASENGSLEDSMESARVRECGGDAAVDGCCQHRRHDNVGYDHGHDGHYDHGRDGHDQKHVTDRSDEVNGSNEHASAGVRFVDPRIRQFSDLARWMDSNEDVFRGSTVLMYCTGGVRCEAASAYLRSKGPEFRNVYQLAGGIVRYLEAFPDGGYFVGKNFVFDHRLCVGPPASTTGGVGPRAAADPVDLSTAAATGSRTAAAGAGAQSAAETCTIVGRCLMCLITPCDDYSPRLRCQQCRMLMLVCASCCARGDEAGKRVCELCAGRTQSEAAGDSQELSASPPSA